MHPDIVLHQWEISPFCQKVARALRHKGLAFRTVDYNGITALRAARLSTVGKLPVLDIGSERVQDSTHIARRLDALFPEHPLFPVDPQQRAQVELWEDWSDELLYWYEVYFRCNDADAFRQAVAAASVGRPAWERPITAASLKTTLSLQLKAQGLGRMHREDVDIEFARHLDRIDTVLDASGWLVGEHKTIADIAVGSQLLEVQRTTPHNLPLAQYPRLAAWLETLR